MKVWLKADEVECEVSARAAFSPDILHELVNRALEMVITVGTAQVLTFAMDEDAPEGE